MGTMGKGLAGLFSGILFLGLVAGCGGGGGAGSVTSDAPALTTIEVTPTNPAIAVGTSRRLTATGIYADGSKRDLTSTVTWSSATPAVATVSNTAGTNGIATAVAAGSTVITATAGGLSGTTTLTVTSATLVTIQVSPANPTIAGGTSQQFTAVGVFSDTSRQDITFDVTWASSSATVATIGTAATSRGLAAAVGAGMTTISATRGAVSGSTTLTVTAVTLAALQVNPVAPAMASGMTLQFSATGVFSDGTKQDLTTSATWSSSSATVATVSAAGLATGLSAGTTTVSATFAGVTGSTVLTVTPATLAAIEIAPLNAGVALGATRQFTAIGRYSDNSVLDVTADVVWASSNPGAATVSNAAGSNGLATPVTTGTTTISARLGSVSASTTLTVTAATLVALEITPTNPTIPRGSSLQFLATGRYSDGSHQDLTSGVTWGSSDSGVATIGNAAGSIGMATGVAAGSATISAQLGNVAALTTLTVSAATLSSIQVTPAAASIPNGMLQQFTATGVYSDSTTLDLTTAVTWSSSAGAVAAISNAAGSNGLATTTATGATTIAATLGAVSGSTVLTVTPATLVSLTVTPVIPVIAMGTTLAFSAVGTYSDNTIHDLSADVTWTSSAPAVAAISNAPGAHGVATGLSSGATTITASLGSVSAGTTLTVTAATLVAIEVTPTNPSVPKGLSRQFAATGRFSDNSVQDLTFDATWSSTTPAVATISNASASVGLATTVATGSTVISASFGGISAGTTLVVTAATLVSIDVTPTTPTTPRGTTVQFTATGTYTDNSTQDLTSVVTWSSSAPGVATVSSAPGTSGLATAVGGGTATITATMGSVSGSTDLGVTAATLVSIEIAPTNPSMPKGTILQLAATGIYSDNSTLDLTSQVAWSSSTAATAVVSNTAGTNGLATAVAVGTTTVTAAMGGVSGTTLVTVTPAVLATIDVTPPLPTIALGTKQQFTATGTYSDNTTEDLTAVVTWTSSGETVAIVSSAAGSQGLATSVAPGTATITAALGTITGSTTLTVTNATLVSLDLTPTTPTIPRGTTQQFTATGTFSDNTTQDLTAQATWSSSNTAVATVSNAAGSNGLATALVPGTTTISAGALGMTGSTTLTVTPATLASIAVTPVSATTTMGITVQYTAIGTYSDASTRDITKFVTWASSTRSVATISNSGGTKGMATPVSAGSTTITATSGSIVSNRATLTVTTATLNSISIAPLTPSIAIGTTLQFTATGNFSDGSTQDLTAQVAWSSSAPAVATISNDAATKGTATAIHVGTTTIRAALGGVTASTTLTVTLVNLTSITVTPVNPTINRNATQQFTATGNFSDGSTQDLTKSVTWNSSSKNVATVSNAKGTRGLAKGVAVGTTTIRAVKSNSSAQGSTTLTVQ